jgi:hypothetical protein
MTFHQKKLKMLLTPETAEVDGLHLEIMHGLDVSDRPASGTHQYGMGDRCFAD